METLKIILLTAVIITADKLIDKHFHLHKTLSIAVKIALLLIFFKAAAKILQNKVPFVPSKEITLTPKDLSMQYKTINIKSSGVTIKAWLLYTTKKDNKKAPYIIYCHGNAGNISGRLNIANSFLKEGFNVMLFDYRGYGESTGKPSEKGIYQDAVSVYEYLIKEEKIPYNKINILGISLGCNAALYITALKKANTLILVSPITSAKDIAKKMPVYYIFSYFIDDILNNKKLIKKIQIPILIAHSKEDTTVPYEMGKKLFELCPSKDKEFITLSGEHSEDYFFEKNFMDKIKKFILKHSK